MVHAANARVESEFLALWGSEEYRTLTVSEDDTARREAVAGAAIRVEELERRMRSAGRDERRALNAALLAAYDALDDAQAIPAERREAISETGQTIAQVWAEADDEARERLVAAFGSFVVHPARATASEDRVTWEGLTPDAATVNGKAARVVLVDAPETAQRSLAGAPRTLPPGLRVVLRVE